MYKSLNSNLTSFTYLIERVSIVTKDFLKNTDKNNNIYDSIYKIYKSTQSINYEFTKLYYNIKAQKELKISLPDIDKIQIPVEHIKNIDDYKNFITMSYNSLKGSLKLICDFSKDFSEPLVKEFDNFHLLIKNLNSNKESLSH